MLKSHLDTIFSPEIKRIVVAYSGGLDSHVLLHSVWALIKSRQVSPALCALHVNHSLSENSLAWQKHCELVCEGLGVDLFTFKVEVRREGSLETNARKARYQLFDSFLEDTDLLLLAHHQDDQIETAFFRLIRGQGFGGMPDRRKLKRASLYRPFLETARAQIEKYAHEQQLSWIEDESNKDTAFDRNFIRLTLFPLIRERWPHLGSNLKRVLGREVETSRLVGLLGEMDLEQTRLQQTRLQQTRPQPTRSQPTRPQQAEPGLDAIDLSSFRALLPLRKKNLLRYWIQQADFPQPSDKFISDALQQMESSDTFGLHWGRFEIRGYQNKAYLMQENPPASMDKTCTLAEYATRYPRELKLEPVSGCGLKASLETRLKIRFRRGGEKVKLSHRRGTRKLKTLFQEEGIPPWIRDRVPLIYLKNELVAVPAVPEWHLKAITGSEVQAHEDEEGLSISWFGSGIEQNQFPD